MTVPYLFICITIGSVAESLLSTGKKSKCVSFVAIVDKETVCCLFSS